MTKDYFLQKIWVGNDGWPCTWFRKGFVRNAVRFVLFARKRVWWYRSSDGGCYPVIWVRQPNGSIRPEMDTGVVASKRLGVSGGPMVSGAPFRARGEA